MNNSIGSLTKVLGFLCYQMQRRRCRIRKGFMHKAPQIAPPAELLRYLAVFHRVFVAVDDYTRHGDREGMLLGGYLADALHNVPALLWRYSTDDWYYHIDASLKAFPEEVLRRGANKDIVNDCERILAQDGAARELGVQDDLLDFDLAPIKSLDKYLDMIYRACLAMRLMRNYSPHPPADWQGLEEVWTAKADDQAAFNGVMASVLRPVPSGLVRWGQFDEVVFRRTALAAKSRLPAAYRHAWRTVFERKPTWD